LLDAGHHVVCLVRDVRRLNEEYANNSSLEIIEADLLNANSLNKIPKDIEAAYYLVHSMGADSNKFFDLENSSALNFTEAIKNTTCKQIIYLGGIVNSENLSTHLSSRLNVENVLNSSSIPVTILRAAIIIGSGSASFEIIRDLGEKLPIMTAPKWILTRCQPIAIRDVLTYLSKVLNNVKCFNQTFDIGGPDILTYKDMILGYAKVRGLKRKIFVIPYLSPRISSYWLYFVTSTTFSLAQSLVDSMKNEVICGENKIRDIININLISYEHAIYLAIQKIEQNSIVSSWKDALNKGLLSTDFMNQIKVPVHGTLQYKVRREFHCSLDSTQMRLWRIGGETGWYYWDWIWNLRGFFDKMVGGVGTRRGRRSNIDLRSGDALDFWRVLIADKKNHRLLLYAEMKLPGEAWLEFNIIEKNGKKLFIQTATFRPSGLWGRLYWLAMWPFHFFVFNGMAKEIAP
jgi:uncharacterized protein YbjT (DUF2867 family)